MKNNQRFTPKITNIHAPFLPTSKLWENLKIFLSKKTKTILRKEDIMAGKVSCNKLLLRTGILLFFVWFLIFTINPESVYAAFSFAETQGFLLRIYGIFQLGWVVLLIIATKNVESNIAIYNATLITGVLVVISLLAYKYIETTTGLWQLLCATVIFVYSLILYITKPKTA